MWLQELEFLPQLEFSSFWRFLHLLFGNYSIACDTKHGGRGWGKREEIEEEAGREPVAAVPAAGQVMRKHLTVT